VELIQQIGSYAGLAAILGLAVLSALYFSQSRDVKRLREWAGRAPERDAEARSRVSTANNMRQTPAAQAQAAPAAQPVAAAGNSGNSGKAAAPAVAAGKAPALAASAAAAGAAARGGVTPPARSGQRVSAQTSVLAAQEPPRERWYRRIAPRYIALIVAGVLILGGGGTVGVLQLLKKDTKSSPAAAKDQPTTDTAAEAKPAPAPIKPGDVSVAVFNATGVQGLASQYGDQAQAAGFVKDNVGNFRSGQRAESVVMYAPGHKREAQLVRREFDVNQIEQADQTVRADAPQADVILVIGADKSGG
jgi:hypothetical protein